eukprot:EG_transcript_18865
MALLATTAAQEDRTATTLKERIKSLAEGTQNGTAASPEAQAEVARLVAALERLNPEPAIATAPKLTGNWRLVYTTNTGNSAGKFGPFVGDVFQDINYEAGKYVNVVRLGGVLEARLAADWEVTGASAWAVRFRSIQFRLFGVLLKEQESKGRGTWRMTYLDDDLRVLHASGRPGTENVYILARQ